MPVVVIGSGFLRWRGLRTLKAMVVGVGLGFEFGLVLM